MQCVPFLCSTYYVDQIIAPFIVSMLSDPFHQTSSYQYLECLKEYMEVLKEGLSNFIQEMIPNGENILEETHDEKKINVNHDSINSNVGWKNHHIPKMDMRMFDGKDPVTWILQMEQYFDLNNVQHTQKVRIATLHLYGIDGFAPLKKLSLCQFLWRK